METDNNQEKFYTLGEMARLGLIMNRNNGGAIKDKSYLTKVLRGQQFTVVPTKYGPGKGLSQAQIDAYNATVTPRWKHKETKVEA